MNRARRVVPFVFLTVFLDLIGFGIIIPLLPVYVKSMGGSAQIVGFILASFSFTQLLATPVLGRLSDRFGRRPVILISLAGNAASMVIFALATKMNALPLLFVSRVLAGATAGNLAACQAAIADVTRGEERAKGMGRVGAAIGLGMVMGPASGSALSAIGPFAPPLGAAALALVDLVGAFFWMPETRAPSAPAERAPDASGGTSALRAWATRALENARADKRLLVVFALYFFLFLAMSNLQVALPLMSIERLGWSEREIGAGFASFGAITLVVQGVLIGRIVRRFKGVDIAVAGGALMGAGLLCMALAQTTLVLAFGIALMALGMGVNSPVLSTMASELAGEARRGVVLGFAQSSGGLARTVGPVWAGFLFTRFGSEMPFLGGAAAAALLAFSALALKRAGTDSAAADAPTD